METWLRLYPQEVEQGSNRPHYKIICRIDGVEHEAAFWPATDKDKNPAEGFSGKLQPKTARANGERKLTQAAEVGIAKLAATIDDEIPF